MSALQTPEVHASPQYPRLLSVWRTGECQYIPDIVHSQKGKNLRGIMVPMMMTGKNIEWFMAVKCRDCSPIPVKQKAAVGQLHQKRTVVEKGNLQHVSPPKTSAAPYQIAGRRDWLLIFVPVYGIFVEMSIFSLDLQRGPALRIDWGERRSLLCPIPEL